MQNCKKCLEDKWKFEFIEGWIRATCQICGYEVEFMSRKLKKKQAKIDLKN